MKYSSDLASNYSKNREEYNETDSVILNALKNIGVEDKKVLDLGCGDGRYALTIRELGASQVIGIDVSEKMIDLARKNTAQDSNIILMVADGRNIPVEDGSMDLVFSNFVIHYFSDTKEIFTEIYRVLKNGGSFIGTFNVTDVEPGFEYLYNSMMPIRLGHNDESIIVQNLIKSKEEIIKTVTELGFIINEEKELDHPNAVVDDSFKNKSNIIKHTIMLNIQKPK
jgi:ubiquinone/menaquinone biosynthesis C-methylase UbiE